MPHVTNPKRFWEDKILTWEQDRYGSNSPTSILEKFAHRASNSLHRRAELAKQILGQNIEGKKILELGCGSGLLSESIINAGAQSYTGVDIAAPAIENASRIAAEKGLSSVINFEVSDLQNIGTYDVDIVFSLGLTDWLTDDEIEKLFSHFKSADFLHSFSEKRNTLSQLLHRLYCYIAYGHKTNSYVPRYLSVSQIAGVVEKSGYDNLHVLRDPGMNFGIFMTSFEVPGSVPVDMRK